MSERKLVLSVTAKDCVWEYMPAGKNGGQNGNKNSTACRVTHPPSGARGESREYKSQLQNCKAAWRRMVESKPFQLWLKRRLGTDMVAESEAWRARNTTPIEIPDSDLKWEYGEDARQ